MDYKDEIKMAMMDPRERNNPRPGRVTGEAGGGGVPALKAEPNKAIEDILHSHASGKASNADVHRVLQEHGWKGNLRGNRAYELIDPMGNYHHHWP